MLRHSGRLLGCGPGSCLQIVASTYRSENGLATGTETDTGSTYYNKSMLWVSDMIELFYLMEYYKNPPDIKH